MSRSTESWAARCAATSNDVLYPWTYKTMLSRALAPRKTARVLCQNTSGSSSGLIATTLYGARVWSRPSQRVARDSNRPGFRLASTATRQTPTSTFELRVSPYDTRRRFSSLPRSVAYRTSMFIIGAAAWGGGGGGGLEEQPPSKKRPAMPAA